MAYTTSPQWKQLQTRDIKVVDELFLEKLANVLEHEGFRVLGDFTNLSSHELVIEDWNRFYLDNQGFIVGSIVHIRFSRFSRFKFLLRRKKFNYLQTVFATELDDGKLITTTSRPSDGYSETTESLTFHHPEASIADLLSHHRRHVATALSEQPERQRIHLNNMDDVLALITRQQLK